MKQFAFEKLDVWNRAKSFVVDIYKETTDFPEEEKFGLISQLRRATVSISSNIAEGSSRTTAKDQRRFYMMAYSSAIEVLNQLIICRDLNFLEEKDYENLRNKLEQITAMLNALHKSTRK